MVKSAYIHIPFCRSKCPYCDFNSYDNIGELKDEYVRALGAEINAVPKEPLETVYFGGGTPTFLDASDLAYLLDLLPRKEDSEVTIEANPGTVDFGKLLSLRRAGFNRLSLGVQSVDDRVLKRIGRIHTAAEAERAYGDARRAGFENIGMDLMFALPNETFSEPEYSLGRIIDLRPEHVSVYELSIEDGTPFALSGVETPDDEYKTEAYLYIIDTLSAAGYDHYEVSNFARPGFESRHNFTYWRNEPYYGFGAGAAEYLNGTRSRKTGDVAKYIAGGDIIEFSERITGKEKDFETVSLALRTKYGLNPDDFPDFKPSFRRLIEKGMLVREGGRVRASRKGLLLLNDLLCEIE